PVLALCLCGAVTGLSMLYQDFFRPMGQSTGVEVAELTGMEHSVRRKAAASFLWQRMESGATFYEKDAVQVGAESSATVRLKDGSVLEIGENSLVVLEDPRQVPLQFMQGSFVVRKESGDTLVKVEKGGQTKTETLNYRLRTPVAQSFWYTVRGSEKEVRFEWDKVGKGVEDSQAHLEVSTGRGFIPSATRSLPLDAAGSTLARFGAGQYYWRLSSGKKALTETRSFRVSEISPLLPVGPTPQSLLQTHSSATRVDFQWRLPDRGFAESAQSELQVSQDADFSSLVYQSKISEASLGARVDGLVPGKYFWRLRSEVPGVNVSSQPVAFTIAIAEKLKIELLSPMEDSSVEQDMPLAFRWQVPGIQARYRVELLAETAGANPTQWEVPGDGSWRVKAPVHGSYTWRVTAFAGPDKVAESGWRRLRVLDGKPLMLTAPTDRTRFQHWKEPAEFQFQWDPAQVLGQKDIRYALELSRDSAFSKVEKSLPTQTTQVAHANIKLADGKWFWRVRALDAQGQLLRVSKGLQFELAPFETLKAPEKAFPENGKRIAKASASDDPVLTWGKVDNAGRYLVKIRQNGKLWRQAGTKETQLPLKGILPGTYEWSVQSVDPLDRAGDPTAWNRFEVLAPKRLRAPALFLK
ncbi:FecR family protein, partial [bacterium]|nr:FecR family protein [bacterium]